MADITTHLERLAKTAMELEIPVLLEAKEEILRLRQSWHLHRNEIERLREALDQAAFDLHWAGKPEEAARAVAALGEKE